MAGDTNIRPPDCPRPPADALLPVGRDRSASDRDVTAIDCDPSACDRDNTVNACDLSACDRDIAATDRDFSVADWSRAFVRGLSSALPEAVAPCSLPWILHCRD